MSIELANKLNEFCEDVFSDINDLLNDIKDQKELKPRISSLVRKAGVQLEELVSKSGARIVDGKIVSVDSATQASGVAHSVAEKVIDESCQVYSVADIAKQFMVSERTASRRMQGTVPVRVVKRVSYFTMLQVAKVFSNVMEATPEKPSSNPAELINNKAIEKLVAATGCRDRAELVQLLKHLVRE